VNRAPLRSAEGRCGAGTAPRLGYLGHGRGSATTPGQPLSHGKLHGGTRCSWGKEGRTRRVRGAAEFWARVLWGSSSTEWGVGCPQPCVPAASAACGSAVQAGLERVSGSSSPDGRPSTAAMLGAFPGSGRLARAASGGVRAKAAWRDWGERGLRGGPGRKEVGRDLGGQGLSGSVAGGAGASAGAGRGLPVPAISSAAWPESPAWPLAPGSPLRRISGCVCSHAAPRGGWSSLLGGFQAWLDVARASVAWGG